LCEMWNLEFGYEKIDTVNTVAEWRSSHFG
jgi:hypothetical protein